MTTDQDDLSMPNELPIDADLELLESHLDGALDPAEDAALRARLTAEPELVDALEGLRADRTLRRTAFASLEPDGLAVERLAWRVRGAVAAELNRQAAPAARRSLPWGWFRLDPWRLARIGGAAAACVVLGFLGGRLGRGPGAASTVAVTPTSVVAPVVGRPSPAIASTGVDMPITDEYGQVVDRQHFDSPEQARRFNDDLRRAYDGSTPAPVDGHARLASELRY
jgi:hypothetical protein